MSMGGFHFLPTSPQQIAYNTMLGQGVAKPGSSPSTPAAATPAGTPPPTPDNPQAIAAMQYLYGQQMNRKSISSTILAGNSGGWSPPAPKTT